MRASAHCYRLYARRLKNFWYHHILARRRKCRRYCCPWMKYPYSWGEGLDRSIGGKGAHNDFNQEGGACKDFHEEGAHIRRYFHLCTRLWR